MWSLTITKADNGYVLSYQQVNESDNLTETKYIAVEDPEDGDETVTTQKMLFEVMEHFCLCGSKHDKVRVKVIREGADEEV